MVWAQIKIEKRGKNNSAQSETKFKTGIGSLNEKGLSKRGLLSHAKHMDTEPQTFILIYVTPCHFNSIPHQQNPVFY